MPGKPWHIVVHQMSEPIYVIYEGDKWLTNISGDKWFAETVVADHNALLEASANPGVAFYAWPRKDRDESLPSQDD